MCLQPVTNTFSPETVPVYCLCEVSSLPAGKRVINAVFPSFYGAICTRNERMPCIWYLMVLCKVKSNRQSELVSIQDSNFPCQILGKSRLSWECLSDVLRCDGEYDPGLNRACWCIVMLQHEFARADALQPRHLHDLMPQMSGLVRFPPWHSLDA